MVNQFYQSFLFRKEVHIKFYLKYYMRKIEYFIRTQFIVIISIYKAASTPNLHPKLLKLLIFRMSITYYKLILNTSKALNAKIQFKFFHNLLQVFIKTYKNQNIRTI